MNKQCWESKVGLGDELGKNAGKRYQKFHNYDKWSLGTMLRIYQKYSA